MRHALYSLSHTWKGVHMSACFHDCLPGLATHPLPCPTPGPSRISNKYVHSAIEDIIHTHRGHPFIHPLVVRSVIRSLIGIVHPSPPPALSVRLEGCMAHTRHAPVHRGLPCIHTGPAGKETAQTRPTDAIACTFFRLSIRPMVVSVHLSVCLSAISLFRLRSHSRTPIHPSIHPTKHQSIKRMKAE